MRTLYGVGLVFFIVAITIFCLQNLETVAVNYLGWSLSLPLPFLVLIIYLLGMVSGWGVVGFIRRSIRIATGHESQTAKSQ